MLVQENCSLQMIVTDVDASTVIEAQEYGSLHSILHPLPFLHSMLDCKQELLAKHP